MPYELYPWIRALHIIAVIAWMAALLYMPRLFVYHCEVAAGSPESERFKIMERRLLGGIANPAMVAVWVLGGLLLWISPMVDWSSGWIYCKLVLVMGMSEFHHRLGRWRKEFAADANKRPQRFYRFINEVPTLLMIAIVILAVVKPF
jgi:putative membrane protein